MGPAGGVEAVRAIPPPRLSWERQSSPRTYVPAGGGSLQEGGSHMRAVTQVGVLTLNLL